MTFQKAQGIRTNDMVVVKSDGHSTSVTRIEIDGKDIFLYCSDGKVYHHTAIK